MSFLMIFFFFLFQVDLPTANFWLSGPRNNKSIWNDLTVWQESAQAPGDEDTHCLNERAQANDVYQSLTKTLMDSRNYEELISGSCPHWQQLDHVWLSL